VSFTDYDIECIKKAKALIDADISKHITITFLSEKVGIGNTKLKRGFKQLFGMGLYTYLRKQRMEKAAELIRETNRTIKGIAKATGFRYSSNFISAFKSYHGMPPGKYRAYSSINEARIAL
jgi:AraC-like DNA-binding protein